MLIFIYRKISGLPHSVYFTLVRQPLLRFSVPAGLFIFQKTAEVVFVAFAVFSFLVSGAILTFAQFLKIGESR